ncbi:metalloregulator ArsR/SmtB family transcription factor [Sessilibacter corallicola]|uniref:Metalloregulator ArsR/SmtB family transcription factor n=1 Tax=Sessilibacter corallicola TaxID=2904075 RepID=A0ABQ0A5K4_9GAMM
MTATETTNQALNDLSALLKAASDPLRLQVLRLLAQDSYGVSELCRIFSVRQSGMSHHLKILSQAGLVTTRREGNSIFYRRTLPNAFTHESLRNEIYTQVDQLEISQSVVEQLEVIRNERVSSSQEFFSLNNEKFRSQQDLIASFPVYKEQISELMKTADLPSADIAVEIGPGEGEFLPVLADAFSQVYAIDNNNNMLESARVFADNSKARNIEFILDDASSNELALGEDLADLIVANMVCHHVPSPANLFAVLAKTLKNRGSLIITDLCLHNQNWTREACGDLWLGFDPNDLSQWAQNAGLSDGQSIYFALRNGFQIQIRQFIKNNAI